METRGVLKCWRFAELCGGVFERGTYEYYADCSPHQEVDRNESDDDCDCWERQLAEVRNSRVVCGRLIRGFLEE